MSRARQEKANNFSLLIYIYFSRSRSRLAAPNFVSSFRYGEHVYFLFKEIAIEHINCGKTVYSRVARVCINDAGGPTRALRDRWTSFAKARLNCSVPGEFPFAFDEIQSSTQVLSSAYQQAAPLGQQTHSASWSSSGLNPNNNNNHLRASDLIYAVFTTPQNSIGGSAICAFRMVDIEAAFEGPFKAQAEGPHSQWLALAEARVPQAPSRPGRCVNDSRRLPDEQVSFMRDNPLMDRAVEPIWSQPLLTMASINFRLTQLAVDAQVETWPANGAQLMRTDVIYAATDDGRVFKLINTFHLGASQAVHRALAASPSGLGAPPAPPLLPTAARLAMQQQQQPPPLPSQQREPVVDVSASTIVIEELHLFDSRTPVLGLLLHSGSAPDQPGKLVVASARQLKAIPLSRCERAQTCADCIALYDPYCAWDTLLQSCRQLGRSPLGAGPPTSGWFAPNSAPAAQSNRTLAWWTNACPPAGPEQLLGPAASSVGSPFKSMFSSHLQVPVRFDFASGHHLSRSPHLLPLGFAPPGLAAPARQPVSECLTFCGAGSGVVPVPADQSGASSCAEYFGLQQQSRSPAGGLLLQYQAASGQNEQGRLYSTVILSILCALLLGLLFGFLFGKRSMRCGPGSALSGAGAIGIGSKHHDSSLCSSTFDETNLYMNSTGSQQANAALAALHQQQQQQQQQSHLFASQQQQQQLVRANSHHYQTNVHQHQRLGFSATLEQQQQHNNQSDMLGLQLAGQTSLGAASAQQLLLQLAGEGASSGRSPKGALASAAAGGGARTGALPPIPMQQQQPLVSHSNGPNTSTHIQHSQLTPPTSSGNSSASNSAGSSGSSSTAQMMLMHQQQPPVEAQQQQQQLYLNQQQLKLASAGASHQRSFSGASQQAGGAGGPALSANGLGGATSFQSAQQQQQQVNKKFYL